MLSVKSPFVTRTIVQSEIVRTAREAQEEVLHGIEIPTQQPPRPEQLVEAVFLRGARQKTIRQIHELSHHTASLHVELEKPVAERNPTLIQTHTSEIQQAEKRIVELTSGESLVFAKDQGRTIVGHAGYLIQRSPASICPTGIALYKPEDRGFSSVPKFKTIKDIGVHSAHKIRAGGTKDAAIICCEGRLFKIKFDKWNMPSLQHDKLDLKWQLLQFRLYTLWETDQRLFAFNPQKSPAGTLPPALPQAATGETEPPAQRIPTFESDKTMFAMHFESIRTIKQLKVNNTLYHVRFDEQQQHEPVLLCEDGDLNSKSIQLRLLKIWIIAEANRALRHMDAICIVVSLRNPGNFPDTGSELFRIRTLLELDSAWDTNMVSAEKDFATIVEGFRKPLKSARAKLRASFEWLIQEREDIAIRKKLLLATLKQLAVLTTKEQIPNQEISIIKGIYSKLFQLASNCTSNQMQEFFFKKISGFSQVLTLYIKTDMRESHTNKLNVAIRNQKAFLKLFPSIKRELNEVMNGPAGVMFSDGTTTALPTTKRLTDLRDGLCSLSGNVFTPWGKVQNAMRQIKDEQHELAIIFVAKVNRGLELNLQFQAFLGQDGEGLNLETGDTFYTPKTYARIVTLIELRNQLLNKTTIFSEEQILEVTNEFNEHVRHIKDETDLLEQASKSMGFIGHRRYQPELNTSGTVPFNFSQWCDDQKIRAQELSDENS